MTDITACNPPKAPITHSCQIIHFQLLHVTKDLKMAGEGNLSPLKCSNYFITSVASTKGPVYNSVRLLVQTKKYSLNYSRKFTEFVKLKLFVIKHI